MKLPAGECLLGLELVERQASDLFRLTLGAEPSLTTSLALAAEWDRVLSGLGFLRGHLRSVQDAQSVDSQRAGGKAK